MKKRSLNADGLMLQEKVVERFFCSRLLRLFAFSFVFALSACVDQTLDYSQPVGLKAQNAAAIVGSDSGVVGHIDPATVRTYVVGIDNLLTDTGPAGWQSPIFVTPGSHIIQIGACVHDFLGCGGFGFVTLTTNFEAGKTYVLRATQVYKNGPFKPALSDVWVEDASGNRVTASFKLVYGAPAPEMLPIFIPAH